MVILDLGFQLALQIPCIILFRSARSGTVWCTLAFITLASKQLKSRMFGTCLCSVPEGSLYHSLVRSAKARYSAICQHKLWKQVSIPCALFSFWGADCCSGSWYFMWRLNAAHPCLRPLVTRQRKTRFDCRPVYLGFLVYWVTLG
jgi:hypothetical protein